MSMTTYIRQMAIIGKITAKMDEDIEILSVGLIVTLISSLILKRKAAKN